jgi:recombination protein RecR
MYNKFPSKLLDNAVSEFSRLPGIGKKTALRLVLHLLNKSEEDVNYFGNSIIELRKNIKRCKICRNISDNDICEICADNSKNKSIVCVVENIKDVMAVENTGQYNGLFHVLGGLISPMDGIGPDNLEINSLIERASKGEISEIILALSTTPEGDTTNFYLFRKLASFNINITTLSKGVSVGGELEYTDEITLGRSILNRIKFEML